MQKEPQTGQFEDLAHFLSGGGKGRGKGTGAGEEGGLADLGDELTDAEASGETSGEGEGHADDAESVTADTEDTTGETDESPAPDGSQSPAPHGPGFYHWLGGSLLVTGIALGVLPADSNIVHILASAGFSASIVAIAGLVLLATAQVLRAMQNAAQRADWALSRQLAAAEALRGSVDSLADEEGPRVHSGSTDHADVTAALKRLDEKVNNLTRATKMYGKPLMELAGQVTESAEILNHVRTQTDLIAETIGQGLRKFSDTIGERLQKIEHGVAGIDASAVKHSLDKLEATTQKGFTGLKAEDPGVARVEQKLDATTRTLQEALAELKKSDLSKLEDAVREIQRELTSVAATVTNVQTTLRSQPAKTGAAAAAPAPQPTNAAAANNDAHSGAAQNTAGTHTGSGKNVLGAIAKLKQMKS